MSTTLPREEYVEQVYFFRALGERMRQNIAAQDLLQALQEELLSTTKLPMAIEFMSAELRLLGVFAEAMGRLKHYFAPFQTFVVAEAEDAQSRFDFGVAMDILAREAQYRADGAPPQGLFLYQYETLCRNRLAYDRGLEAMSGDPAYDDRWRDFCLAVRKQIGLVDIADLIFVHSEHYRTSHTSPGKAPPEVTQSILFGEKEGRIALANRRKEPLLLFSALQRQLNYPFVPRPKPRDEAAPVLPALLRRVERLEMRLKLLEEEGKGGIDLSQFMKPPNDGGED